MFFSETLLPGVPRPPGDVRLYPRVCLYGHYAPHDRLSPAEKTSLSIACPTFTSRVTTPSAVTRKVNREEPAPVKASGDHIPCPRRPGDSFTAGEVECRFALGSRI